MLLDDKKSTVINLESKMKFRSHILVYRLKKKVLSINEKEEDEKSDY